MESLNALISALLASSAVGAVIALVIQVGKVAFPKAFPDGSADNWRLGFVLVTALGVMIARYAGVPISIPAVEQFAVSLSTFGSVALPLLLLLANWIAKMFYLYVFKGVRWIGKTYTP